MRYGLGWMSVMTISRYAKAVSAPLCPAPRNSNVCCESTARDAMMLNYNVIFVADGTATHSDVEHNATLGNLIANFADIMTTDEVVARIASVSAREAAE